jgi:hypothetical protein
MAAQQDTNFAKNTCRFDGSTVELLNQTPLLICEFLIRNQPLASSKSLNQAIVLL